MKGFLEGNGIKQTLIPAYHPQSNGLAERAVRTIKTALDKNKRKIGDTIQDTLSKVLLAYRSTPHVTTGKTPSELFIGRALRTRVSLIHPSLTSRVRDQQARQMKYDRRTQLEEFQIDDLVWCKNFRGGDKWIPGKIVGKKGTRVYNHFDPRTGFFALATTHLRPPSLTSSAQLGERAPSAGPTPQTCSPSQPRLSWVQERSGPRVLTIIQTYHNLGLQLRRHPNMQTKLSIAMY
ncbi:K02A2.6-like [Cordylochernes scorpioides]|uniref:K02A2.6-like n=1 Tax=Cordylochernes scorpioides TaxID=51811 RepID=A0ABY6K1Y9_9ARAC|nr:K02A2.6-like [Cordylochernes scorpioides]